jgi:hypothetical protein
MGMINIIRLPNYLLSLDYYIFCNNYDINFLFINSTVDIRQLSPHESWPTGKTRGNDYTNIAKRKWNG